MRLNRPIMMFGFMVMVIIALVMFYQGNTNCETERPPLPVYPGSVPLGEYPVVQVNTHEIIQYEYSSSASPSELQGFFRQNGNCDTSSDDFRCSVALNGNSTYTAIVPNTSNNGASYILQLNWDRCGIGWDAIEGFR